MKKWYTKALKKGVYAVMLDDDIIGAYSDDMIVYPKSGPQRHYIDDALPSDGKKRAEVDADRFCQLLGFPRMTWV